MKRLHDTNKITGSPVQVFRKLMEDDWMHDTRNASATQDSSFFVSISKRLDSLNAVIARDKTSGMLTEIDEKEQPLLFSFLNSILKFISKCLASVASVHTNGATDSGKYVEACGDSFKVIVAALKPRLRLSMSSSSWPPICESLLATSAMVLHLKSAPKDAVTSAAMTFVSALYIRAARADELAGAKDRSNLNHCLYLLLKLLDKSADGSQLDMLIGEGDVRVTGFPLSLLVQCSLLRAIISVFDDDMLCPLLVQAPVSATLCDWCREPLPEVRQYALQTVGSWLDRLGTLLSNMAHCGSLLRMSPDVESLLRRVAALLIASWTHPSKQVSHTVSGVYEKVLALLKTIRSKRAASGTNMGVSDDAFWGDFVSDALSLPAQNRARYQAIANLLPVVGASPFLRSHPSLVAHLISECRLREVCAPCVALVVAFLRQLHTEQTSTTPTTKGPKDLVADSDAQSDMSFTSESPKKSRSSKKTTGADSSQLPVTDPVKDSLRVLWDRALVEILCTADEHARANASSFLVPEILSFDPLSGPHLLSSIDALKNSPQYAHNKLEDILWGRLSVCFHARQLNLPGKDIVFSSQPSAAPLTDSVSSDEIRMACVSQDGALRLLALHTLTSCHQTTSALDKRELEIFQQSIKYCLTGTLSDDRQYILRALNSLLSRMYEGYRVAVREKKRMTQRITALERDLNELSSKQGAVIDSSAETILLLKVSESQLVIAECDEQFQSFDKFCSWLCEEVCQHLAPDISVDRQLMCLEIINTIFEHTNNTIDPSSITGTSITYASYFHTNNVVSSILSLLQSKVDRSRVTASELLFKFPRPLPGYQNTANVNLVLAKACQLSGSAKQREAESGALFIKFIFFVYSVDLKWAVAAPVNGQESTIYFTSTQPDSSVSVDSTKPPPSVDFVHRLVDLLEARLATLSSIFEQLGDINNYIYQLSLVKEGLEPSSGTTVSDASTPSAGGLEALCNGLVTAIRFCLEKIALSATGQLLSSATIHHWRALFRRVLAVVTRAMTLAMTVVAEAKSDEPFAAEPNLVSSKGPINSATAINKVNSMAATYVNTNGLMGATSSDGDEDGGADASSGAQRAVVAAWLLVKESCGLLAALVDISCGMASIDTSLSASRGVKSSKSNKYRLADTDVPSAVIEALLDVDDVTSVGATILDALGRLKHMGAIFEAQLALQKVCEAIFRQRNQSDSICRLPSLWLDSLLSRLDNHLQVFILRRSAGFAYSFTAILRPEFSRPKVLLPVALNALLRHVEAGLSTEDTAVGYDIQVADGAISAVGSDEKVVVEALEGLNAEQWRMSVHALNVLRLILADSVLGPDLDPFLAHAAELSIRGFRSSKWAVRNSSMMMFASVVQRTIDHEKHDSGGTKATSVMDFFGRFPSLFPFLLRELSLISPSLLQESDSKNAGTIHPSLYPILLLLSKLRSAVFRAELRPGAATNYSSLIPFIQLCSRHRVMKIRQIAAKALCSLTALEAVAEKAGKLLQPLVDALSNGKHVVSNHVHGRLMLVFEVLDAFRRHSDRLGSVAAVTAVVVECEISLQEPLEKLGNFIFLKDSFYYRCAAVQSVFLNILGCLYQLSSSHTQSFAFASLLLQGSSEIIKSLFDLSLAPKQPYIAVLRRDGIAHYTRLSLARDMAVSRGQESSLKSGVIPLEKLYTLLGHAVSEVREGVLLGVEHVLSNVDKSAQSGLGNYILTSPSFQTLVARLLLRSGQEKEPPVAALTMSVLSRISQEVKLSAYSEAVVLRFHQSWDPLSALIVDRGNKSASDAFAITPSTIRPTSTATYTIQVLGWIMESVLSQPSTAVDTRVLCSSRWIDVLEAASAETQSVDHRLACVRSISFSHALPFLLQRAIASETSPGDHEEIPLSGLCIRLWLVVLSLLEDDDEEVRSETNSTLNDVMKSTRFRVTPDAVKDPFLAVADMTGRSVTTVETYTTAQLVPFIAVSLQWRARCVVTDDPVLRQLLNRVSWGLGDIASAESFIAECAHDQQLMNAGTPTKIFETEPTNLYEEPLVHSVLLMRSLIYAVNKSAVGDNGTAILAQQLQFVLTDCLEGLNLLTRILSPELAPALSRQAIGVTFEPTLFAPLYGRLHLLSIMLSELNSAGGLSSALSSLIDTLTDRRANIASLFATEDISEHRLHPLIVKTISHI